MIRVQITDHRHKGVPPVETTVVVCDGCGTECRESLQHDADHGNHVDWVGLSALASAKSAGWGEKFRGRLRQDVCPSCTR